MNQALIREFGCVNGFFRGRSIVCPEWLAPLYWAVLTNDKLNNGLRELFGRSLPESGVGTEVFAVGTIRFFASRISPTKLGCFSFVLAKC